MWSPCARLLDLDDVGALVGEDHGRPRPRQHRGQIDDADARERSVGRLAHAHFAHPSLIRARSFTSIPGKPYNVELVKLSEEPHL